jgi:hypothetical protein
LNRRRTARCSVSRGFVLIWATTGEPSPIARDRPKKTHLAHQPKASGRPPQRSSTLAHGGHRNPRSLAAAVLAAAAADAVPQDPLRGRELYLNAAEIKGAPMRSGVQCHGLPPETKLKGANVAQLYGALANLNARCLAS